MNEWLGPSAVSPQASEEELSNAVPIDGPFIRALGKVLKFLAWFSAITFGLVIAFLFKLLHDVLYDKNTRNR